MTLATYGTVNNGIQPLLIFFHRNFGRFAGHLQCRQLH